MGHGDVNTWIPIFTYDSPVVCKGLISWKRAEKLFDRTPFEKNLEILTPTATNFSWQAPKFEHLVHKPSSRKGKNGKGKEQENMSKRERERTEKGGKKDREEKWKKKRRWKWKWKVKHWEKGHYNNTNFCQKYSKLVMNFTLKLVSKYSKMVMICSLKLISYFFVFVFGFFFFHDKNTLTTS